MRRLATIAAAEAMVHLVNVPGRFHALTGDRRGQYALSLSDRLRLIVEPVGNPLPRTPDGGIDLARVGIVRVVGVSDYHGG
jgi:toxin HigB-1